MISAALNGALDKLQYFKHPIFDLQIPSSCPEVPPTLLNPIDSWADREEYMVTARKLASEFIENFEQYQEFDNDEIKKGGPTL
jgi:phosphoenolpyruvate carboxykinase (ATP)